MHPTGFMGQAAGLPPDLEGSCKTLEKIGRDDGILGTDPIQGFASTEQKIRQGGGWNTIMTSDQARTCYMKGYDEASSTWRDPRYRQGATVGAIAGLIVGVGGTLLVTKVIL